MEDTSGKVDLVRRLEMQSRGIVPTLIRLNCNILLNLIRQLEKESYGDKEIQKIIGQVRLFKPVDGLSSESDDLIQFHKSLWESINNH